MPTANGTDGNNATDSVTHSDHQRPASEVTTQSNGVNTVSNGAAGPGDSGNTSSANSNADNSNAAGQQGSGTNAHPAAPAGTHSPSSGAGPNIGELVNAIQGMPEAVVRAMREATQPAQQPRQRQASQDTGDRGNASQTAAQTGSQGTSNQSHPGKKSFAEWWFGK